jgi:SAM-dependent methyltransferase
MPVDWHLRYLQQASWTRQIRNYLFAKAKIHRESSIIEIGCGTGAILADQAIPPEENQIGIDIDLDNLKRAKSYLVNHHFIQADAHSLPFRTQVFDVSFCHFLLLWVKEPDQVVQEMRRVTHEGGVVLAMAEPDYLGRIDYPKILDKLGKLQTTSLKEQGCQPDMGRKLGEIFSRAGLTDIEIGVLGGQWNSPPTQLNWEMEWEVLKSDLAGYVSGEWLDEMQKIEQDAWEKATRILFIPLFYAFGRVPPG